MKWWHVYLFSASLGLGFAGLKVVWDGRYGKTFVADMSSLENLLNTDLIGSIADTYTYLVPAYSIYKEHLPVIRRNGKTYWVCMRTLSSLPFIPFLFVFGKYFPLGYIFFFSTSVPISLVFLLQKLKLTSTQALVLMLFVSPLIFYHIPRLMLEAPVVLLISGFVASLSTKRYGMAGMFMLLAGVIRGEFAILSLFYAVYMVIIRRYTWAFALALPFLLQIGMNTLCGDQSNFYFWTYRAYVENVEGGKYSSDKIRDCMERQVGYFPEKHLIVAYPFSKVNTLCWEKIIHKEIDFTANLGVMVKSI